MTESFAAYFAKRLIGDKRFELGVPEEAAPLSDKSDIALAYADYSLAIALILDRTEDGEKRFSFTQQELIDVGSACLKYTGTINSAKMPVMIVLYEVGKVPPTEDDRARLKALQRHPGLKKVGITSFYLDTENKSVWSSAPFGGLFQFSPRKWLERVLQEPKKQDEQIFVPDAVLPKREHAPIATYALLALLAGMFLIEHLARLGDEAQGLLGVDVTTLFAHGAMNSDAVLERGEWYRLFSAALLHGDVFHLVLNGVALWLAGSLLESLLGSAWFVVLFSIGALGGSLFGLALNPSNIVSVGASGAVMGLLTSALVAAMRFPPGAARMQIQLPLLQFLIPSLIPLATHRQGGRIDYAAHFGGAIVGALAGFVLMKLWPKTEERPRFHRAVTALAMFGGLCFALSLVLVNRHFDAHAAEASFSTEGLLVDDALIPKDVAMAQSQVEQWGKDHPRDPRVHLFRALRSLGEGNTRAGELELRAALRERQILDRAFSNKKLETSIRGILCELLLQDGRRAEAERAAEPVCKSAEGSAPPELARLGLCQ